MNPCLLFTLSPLFFFFFFLSSLTQASLFTVGDNRGWVVGIVNYTLWASNHTFYVGDYLMFNYVPEFHSVLEVSKAAYDNCDAGNFIAEHRDGNTTVHLKKEGTYYYICGTEKHCPLGQKLEIRVSSLPPPSPKQKKNASMAPSPAPTPLLSASNLSSSTLHSFPSSSSPLSSSSGRRYHPPYPPSILLLLHIHCLFILLLYRQL